MTEPKKLKVYIAGPMSSVFPDWNQTGFAEAEQWLTQQGMEPVNPHSLHPPPPPMSEVDFESDLWKQAWCQYVRTDIATMMTCDAVLVLPGWERSEGARIEVWLAQRLRMDIKAFQKQYPQIIVAK